MFTFQCDKEIAYLMLFVIDCDVLPAWVVVIACRVMACRNTSHTLQEKLTQNADKSCFILSEHQHRTLHKSPLLHES